MPTSIACALKTCRALTISRDEIGSFRRGFGYCYISSSLSNILVSSGTFWHLQAPATKNTDRSMKIEYLNLHVPLLPMLVKTSQKCCKRSRMSFGRKDEWVWTGWLTRSGGTTGESGYNFLEIDLYSLCIRTRSLLAPLARNFFNYRHRWVLAAGDITAQGGPVFLNTRTHFRLSMRSLLWRQLAYTGTHPVSLISADSQRGPPRSFPLYIFQSFLSTLSNDLFFCFQRDYDWRTSILYKSAFVPSFEPLESFVHWANDRSVRYMLY